MNLQINDCEGVVETVPYNAVKTGQRRRSQPQMLKHPGSLTLVEPLKM